MAGLKRVRRFTNLNSILEYFGIVVALPKESSVDVALASLFVQLPFNCEDYQYLKVSELLHSIPTVWTMKGASVYFTDHWTASSNAPVTNLVYFSTHLGSGNKKGRVNVTALRS